MVICFAVSFFSDTWQIEKKVLCCDPKFKHCRRHSPPPHSPLHRPIGWFVRHFLPFWFAATSQADGPAQSQPLRTCRWEQMPSHLRTHPAIWVVQAHCKPASCRLDACAGVSNQKASYIGWYFIHRLIFQSCRGILTYRFPRAKPTHSKWINGLRAVPLMVMIPKVIM